jgi:hypothetical protein
VSTTATAGRRRRGARAIEFPARTRSSPLPDLLIAIALGALAFLLRLNFPTDGLFHDDAWQVLGVANGTFSDFPMVGQAQPGFTFALMVWERLFGSGTTSMLTPALIAGALGPPALYLALRHFGYARSIATLLGAMLTVAATHILFSNRVKTYTADVLVVLLFAVLLPPLARRRWGTRFGVLWFAGSVLAASFSSFALLASVSAGLILVLHAHGDRRVRVVAVAAQCAALVGYLVVVEHTYSSRALRGFWSGKDAFISFSANPITLLDEILDHGLRVTQVFPGGGRAWEWVFLVVAVVGLIASARRGPRRLPARFLGLTAALAFAGAVIHRVPFGPQTSGDGGRVTLWLVPVLAFGIAAVLEFVRRALRERTQRRVLDALTYVLALFVLASAVGATYAYPEEGARAATRAVMAELGPDDAVWITRSAFYPFALQSGTPVGIRATPDRLVGFFPDFADPRLHPVDYDTTPADLDESVQDTSRVYIVNAGGLGSGRYTEYLVRLGLRLQSLGFEHERTDTIGRAHVDVWRRPAD